MTEAKREKLHSLFNACVFWDRNYKVNSIDSWHKRSVFIDLAIQFCNAMDGEEYPFEVKKEELVAEMVEEPPVETVEDIDAIEPIYFTNIQKKGRK